MATVRRESNEARLGAARPEPREILHDDAELRVIRRRGRSAFTLVTFASLTDRPDGRWFWGRGMVERLDLDAVGFIAKRESWYPPAVVARAAPAVRAVLRPVAVGYGSAWAATRR